MEEKKWEADETWDYAKQCASGSIDLVHARRGFETMLRDLAGDEKAGMPDEVKLKRYDDLVELVEELHQEGMVLRQAIKRTLDDNGHLADGEVCTLLPLKLALRQVGTPWAGDELAAA